MKERGISLIALIITIIVIIILAVVVVASAGDVIEDARFAKFEQEFGEYSQALQIAATQKKAELVSSGRTDVTDAQVYYMVAKGLKEPEALPEGKSLSNLGLDIQPSALTGTTYYEVTKTYTEEKEELGGVYAAESNPALNRTTPFYSSTEKVYVTDSGEAFTLPGYPRTKNGVTQHYVNEKKYYTGEAQKGEEEPEEKMITFYINEDEFQAKEGATWGEFCEENENKDAEQPLIGFHLTVGNENGDVVYNGNHVVWEEGFYRPKDLEIRGVLVSEVIEEEHKYGAKSPVECVKGNTEVSTSLTGETKLAKEMMAGNTILYYDFANEKLEEGTVEKVYIHANATNFVTYTFADESYIEVTDYHPIYTQNGWKSFTQRYGYEVPKVGNQVKTLDGWKTLEKIEAYQGLEDCYDFAITGKDGTVVNNYFGNNTLVQNSID